MHTRTLWNASAFTCVYVYLSRIFENQADDNGHKKKILQYSPIFVCISLFGNGGHLEVKQNKTKTKNHT